MTTKHTPGPWNYRPAKNVTNKVNPPGIYDLPAQVTDSNDEAIIRVGGITAEGDANARLIAAAPELLEALQGVVDAYGCECLPNEPKAHCPMCIGRAAIAKATAPTSA